jgi:isopropylmalate/homocitrate/citramalate synthase
VDAEAVVAGMTCRPGVEYSAIWFNADGLWRALAFKDKLTLKGSISLSASEGFSIKNLNRDRPGQIAAMRSFVRAHQDAGVPIDRIIVMASFGCNFSGDIAPAQVVAAVADGLDIARDAGIAIKQLMLADSMGWATPRRVTAAVAAVRERWPDHDIALHLHDTRGQGIACAYEGLRLGVTRFDAAVAGLGGCPFAGHPGAPGNIATEELAIICEEMGIETGLDIEALLEAARLAERVVGHPLPSAALRSGTIASFRRKVA